jgi:hypothetical protein
MGINYYNSGLLNRLPESQNLQKKGVIDKTKEISAIFFRVIFQYLFALLFPVEYVLFGSKKFTSKGNYAISVINSRFLSAQL